MDDFYDLLEVPEDADPAEVKRAWREKAREYHPDVNDDDRANVQFKTLQKAYEVLSDETERAAYDRMGHATYVNRRLDGLPTAGMTRPRDGARGSSRWGASGPRSGSDGRSRASGRSARNRSGSESRSSSDSSASGSGASSNASSRTRSSRRGSGSTANRASSGSTNSSRSSRSSSATESSRRRTASTGSASNRASSGSTGGTGGSTAGATESGTGAVDATRTRHPLWYGWTAVLVAGVAYLAGLAAFLDANAGAVPAFADALAADPATALLGYWFAQPGTYAAEAVLAAPDSGVALAFPAGALLLGVVFAAVVAKFGHGKAYLYLVGGLAPLASLAFGTVAAVEAAGATLALVVLLPVVATTLFLADAGRFLLAES